MPGFHPAFFMKSEFLLYNDECCASDEESCESRDSGETAATSASGIIRAGICRRRIGLCVVGGWSRCLTRIGRCACRRIRALGSVIRPVGSFFGSLYLCIENFKLFFDHSADIVRDPADLISYLKVCDRGKLAGSSSPYLTRSGHLIIRSNESSHIFEERLAFGELFHIGELFGVIVGVFKRTLYCIFESFLGGDFEVHVLESLVTLHLVLCESLELCQVGFTCIIGTDEVVGECIAVNKFDGISYLTCDISEVILILGRGFGGILCSCPDYLRGCETIFNRTAGDVTCSADDSAGKCRIAFGNRGGVALDRTGRIAVPYKCGAVYCALATDDTAYEVSLLRFRIGVIVINRYVCVTCAVGDSASARNAYDSAREDILLGVIVLDFYVGIGNAAEDLSLING